MRKAIDTANDIVTTKVSLNEAIDHKLIELTASANTIRKYNNSTYYHLSGSTIGYTGWYQSLYDGSYLISSSYPLFDVTFGYNNSSVFYASASGSLATSSQKSEKYRMYRQFAGSLLGNKSTPFIFNKQQYNELIFITLNRTLYHDKIRPGYCTIKTSSTAPYLTNYITAIDASGSSNMTKTTYGGNYNELFAGETCYGAVFYDAGIIALDTGVFADANFSGSVSKNETLHSGTLDNFISGTIAHLSGVAYQNTTQLHSTIYFCNVGAKEFNYSSNPSFVDTNGRIIPTAASNAGVIRDSETYITGVVLYDENGNALAVAKLSYPIKKNSTLAMSIRARIDF